MKLITIDPKFIKTKLEEVLGSSVPQKEKKETVAYKHDVWQHKTTNELVRRTITYTEEKLNDKIRLNEFIENCFKTCYTTPGSYFKENYIKVAVPMVYKKLIIKSTNEEISKPKEKIDNKYIYLVKENNKYIFKSINESEVEEINIS
jgi:hypothetical protein